MAHTCVNSSCAVKRIRLFRAALWAVCVLSLNAASADDATSPQAAESPVPMFEQDIGPLLAARCGECHGAEKAEGGLDLRLRATMVAGGDSGTALAPGKPEDSPLLVRVEKGEMPPEGETPLGAAERMLLRRWIAAGAPTAKPEEPPGPAPGIAHVSEEDRAFWAFRPPVRPKVPTVNASSASACRSMHSCWPGWRRRGCRSTTTRPSPSCCGGSASTCTACHRPWSSTTSFWTTTARMRMSGWSIACWRRRGMASAGGAIGWTSPAMPTRTDTWLPIASGPRRGAIATTSSARLNADLPYDRFVTQQVAGDELSDWRRAEELTPAMSDELAATGFLRTASDPTYPGYAEKNECYQVVSDTIQIVSSAFLGMTIQCARCHAHKFDPISQRDYYGLQAILMASYDPERWQPSPERAIPLATEAQLARRTGRESADRRTREAIERIAGRADYAVSQKVDRAHVGDGSGRGRCSTIRLSSNGCWRRLRPTTRSAAKNRRS